MDLKILTKQLEQAPISNLEHIAEEVSFNFNGSFEEYEELFAKRIVEKKLEQVRDSVEGFVYLPFGDDSFYISKKEKDNTVEAVVRICPSVMLPNSKKKSIEAYARAIKKETSGYGHVIQFLPFTCNGKKDLLNLKKQMSISFANLNITPQTTERRFMQYVLNSPTKKY
ncbi:MAG: hypothetical protein ACLFN8_04685 [Candidatus Woesearchaeota archaeon]